MTRRQTLPKFFFEPAAFVVPGTRGVDEDNCIRASAYRFKREMRNQNPQIKFPLPLEIIK